MTSPLDELREIALRRSVMIASQRPVNLGEPTISLNDICEFEERHPGLVDRTRWCWKCGAPIEITYPTWEYFTPSTKWLCPACAEKQGEER